MVKEVKSFDITGLAKDENKVENGVWMDHGALKLLVAHYKCKKYDAFMTKANKKHRRRFKSADLDEETKTTMRIGISRFLLLDWKNLTMGETDAEGNPIFIDYSEQQALDYLIEYDEFFEMVAEDAADNDEYRKDCEKEDQGNL